MKVVYTLSLAVLALLSASATTASAQELDWDANDNQLVSGADETVGADADAAAAAYDYDAQENDVAEFDREAEPEADEQEEHEEEAVDEVGADADVEDEQPEADAELDREAAPTSDEDDDAETEIGADADVGVATAVFEGEPADDFVVEGRSGETEVGDEADDEDDEVGADADMDFSTEHTFGNPEVRQSLILTVNKKRQEAGLAPVCLNYKLHNTAQSQAGYMAKTNLITVVSEDGFNPSQRGRSARFNSSGVAEIIGAGYTKVEDLVEGWMKAADSKSILLGNFTHIGPGYSVNETQPYKLYWVLDFAQGRGENCSGLAI